MKAGEIAPDFGPAQLHRTAGATLLAARPPLVAFNLQLAAPAGPQQAKRIAALIREGGEQGLPGVRAIGIALGPHRDVGQVSLNVEDPSSTPLRTIVEAVSRHARIECAELVGLAPAAAFEGFPQDLPIPRFDVGRHVIENALGL
jgi:glutamate formiminotransferase/glutamate formiminotransferase/formiminotetrahydrofolate cyclodeaminase